MKLTLNSKFGLGKPIQLHFNCTSWKQKQLRNEVEMVLPCTDQTDREAEQSQVPWGHLYSLPQDNGGQTNFLCFGEILGHSSAK